MNHQHFLSVLIYSLISLTSCKVCYPKRDIVFVLDVTEDTDPSDFSLMKDFVFSFISAAEAYINKGYVQTGLLTFADTAGFIYDLNVHSQAVPMQSDIHSISQFGITKTRGGAALVGSSNITIRNTDNAIDRVFQSARWRSSSNYDRIVILLTTGLSDDGVTQAKIAAGSLNIYAIGIAAAFGTELNDISSNPNSQFSINTPSFQSLSTLVTQLTSSILGLTYFTNNDCIKDMCATPVLLANSQICSCTPGLFEEGDTVVFECVDGYSEQGQPRWTCQTGGNWSAEPFSCVPSPYTTQATTPEYVLPLMATLAGVFLLAAIVGALIYCLCPRSLVRCRDRCSCDAEDYRPHRKERRVRAERSSAEDSFFHEGHRY